MNKKIFGIKISTILTSVACVVIALGIWMLVKYKLDISAGNSAIGYFCRK
jgi:hypothetical protein